VGGATAVESPQLALQGMANRKQALALDSDELSVYFAKRA
jgi:hypothetical protein